MFYLFQTVLAVPIIGSLTIVIVFVLSIYQEPYRLGRGLVILAVALPLYIINENWRRMPKSWQRAVGKELKNLVDLGDFVMELLVFCFVRLSVTFVLCQWKLRKNSRRG